MKMTWKTFEETIREAETGLSRIVTDGDYDDDKKVEPH
jgi:hypothetical protein